MEKIKQIDFLDEINHNKLITKKGKAHALVFDAERDPIKCKFNYDESVEIDTKGYSYITLSLDNLRILKNLILEAETYYDNYFKDKCKHAKSH